MGIIRIVSFINNINSTITSFSFVGYKVASFMILYQDYPVIFDKIIISYLDDELIGNFNLCS